MIYLKNKTGAQSLFIPRNGEEASGDMSLVVRNTTDHREFTLSVTDLNISGIYFSLAAVLPEGFADGEYEYALKDGEIIKSSGIIYIGDLRRPDEYEQTITYKQYGSE